MPVFLHSTPQSERGIQMKKFLGVVVAVVGVGLSVLWFVKDPGIASFFKNWRIIVGFIPLPGELFGGLIQLSILISAIALGTEIFNRS